MAADGRPFSLVDLEPFRFDEQSPVADAGRFLVGNLVELETRLSEPSNHGWGGYSASPASQEAILSDASSMDAPADSTGHGLNPAAKCVPLK